MADSDHKAGLWIASSAYIMTKNMRKSSLSFPPIAKPLQSWQKIVSLLAPVHFETLTSMLLSMVRFL